MATDNADVCTLKDVNITCLPEKYVWMKVKAGTKVPNVIDYAKKAIDSGETRALLWSGSGNGVVKTISCVEIMKRDYQLHQLTKLGRFELTEESGVGAKHIPCIHILQSLDQIEAEADGLPKDEDANSDVSMDNGQLAGPAIVPTSKPKESKKKKDFKNKHSMKQKNKKKNQSKFKSK